MRYLTCILVLFVLPLSGNVTRCSAQINKGLSNDRYADRIESLLSYSVPMMTIDDYRCRPDMILLDARSKEEYEISHIPNAIHIGYDDFDESVISQLDKDDVVVLYCSVGYRSEKIGEKLLKRGFSKVYNLYGSIFEWANRGYELVAPDGSATSKIHTYNRKWSRWMTNERYEKVW